MYLSSKEFFSLYPKEFKMAEGAYGKVYDSTDFVVKKFQCDPRHLDLSIELNIYNSIDHPCIIKPIAWTTMNSKGYLAMEKGEDIIKALKNKYITIQEVIDDIVSAVAFLNCNGIVHCDIKPQNIIFLNGKAKLIDMSICKYAELHVDQQYYTTDVAYSPLYRDPEYYSGQYNNIKCEIGALGLTFYTLINNSLPCFGALWLYSCEKFPIFNEAKKFIEDRKCITDLVCDTHKYEGKLIQEDDTYVSPSNKVLELMKRLVSFSLRRNIRARSLFLCLDLIHRTHHKIIFIDDIYLETYGFVTLNLAINIIDQGNTLNFVERKETEEITLQILKLTKGVIYNKTYWDYAKSEEDLKELLIDCINRNYNPKLIRKTFYGSNKSVLVNEFFSEADMSLFDNQKSPSWDEISQVHCCNLRLAKMSGDIKKEEVLNFVLHNQKLLSKEEVINYCGNIQNEKVRLYIINKVK